MKTNVLGFEMSSSTILTYQVTLIRDDILSVQRGAHRRVHMNQKQNINTTRDYCHIGVCI